MAAINGYHSVRPAWRNAANFKLEDERYGLEMEIRHDDGPAEELAEVADGYGIKVIAERDGSLNDYSGVELVTEPLSPEIILTKSGPLDRLINALLEAGGRRDAGNNYGLHVNCSTGGMTNKQVKTFGLLINAMPELCSSVGQRTTNNYFNYMLPAARCSGGVNEDSFLNRLEDVYSRELAPAFYKMTGTLSDMKYLSSELSSIKLPDIEVELSPPYSEIVFPSTKYVAGRLHEQGGAITRIEARFPKMLLDHDHICTTVELLRAMRRFAIEQPDLSDEVAESLVPSNQQSARNVQVRMYVQARFREWLEAGDNIIWRQFGRHLSSTKSEMLAENLVKSHGLKEKAKASIAGKKITHINRSLRGLLNYEVQYNVRTKSGVKLSEIAGRLSEMPAKFTCTSWAPGGISNAFDVHYITLFIKGEIVIDDTSIKKADRSNKLGVRQPTTAPVEYGTSAELAVRSVYGVQQTVDSADYALSERERASVLDRVLSGLVSTR